MGKIKRIGIPVLLGKPQCDRLCGGTKICGEARLLCQSFGRRRLCESPSWKLIERTAGRDRALPAGRAASASLCHLLHGAWHRRGRDRSGSPDWLSAHHLRHHAKTGTRWAQSGKSQCYVPVSQNSSRMYKLRHDSRACQKRQSGTTSSPNPVSRYSGTASSIHGSLSQL